jgi:hypothetical protein
MACARASVGRVAAAPIADRRSSEAADTCKALRGARLTWRFHFLDPSSQRKTPLSHGAPRGATNARIGE